jgi:hypothetical protein
LPIGAGTRLGAYEILSALTAPGQIGTDNAGDQIHVVRNWLEDRRPRLPR